MRGCICKHRRNFKTTDVKCNTHDYRMKQCLRCKRVLGGFCPDCVLAERRRSLMMWVPIFSPKVSVAQKRGSVKSSS